LDDFDDPDGYYRILLGELLDGGRYHVHANLGRGMFSSVVKAKDLSPGEGMKSIDGDGNAGKEVAIKVIRSQESM
jgi:serine/threonine-protein kinase PRP4